MRILVIYSSRYGATGAIAERLGGKLIAAGHEVVVRPVKGVGDLTGFDGFVIGSAVYFGKWRKDAAEFVRRHAGELGDGRPVWLFSSGPLGTEETDDQGRDLRTEAIPREISEFQESIRPRGHRVFFGVLEPKRLGLRDRLIRKLPAGRGLLPEGDFRSWGEIDAWAIEIGHGLAQIRGQ